MLKSMFSHDVACISVAEQAGLSPTWSGAPKTNLKICHDRLGGGGGGGLV